ncbi:DUF6443 domain-containing protein [Mucilaginibacter sp. AW1-3]
MMLPLYRSFKALLIAVSLLFIVGQTDAQQTHVNLGSANASGTYTATQQIALNPGFSALGATGFHAYITPLLVNCNSLGTPNADQNYVQTLTPRQPFTDASTLTSKNTCEVMQSIQYFDGLGRPLQNVQVKGNPDATKDVIQPFAYDAFGRESTKFLSYTTNSGTAGNYRPDALTGTSGYSNSAQYGFYQQTGQSYTTNASPFSVTVFEPSPLNRPLEQGAPGNTWQPSTNRTGTAGRTVVTDHQTNNYVTWASDSTTSRQAARYTATINGDGSRTLNRASSSTATYDVGQLTVSIIKDENWTTGHGGTTETYTDKSGHIVLKRTYNYDAATRKVEVLSTYYVYDDLDLLAFVLPPGVNPDFNTNIDQTALNTWCYQYRYDERMRLTQKRLPGKDWECTVYNMLDKPVATQDGNQRNNHQWIITKYDALGRSLISGIWNSTDDRITLQGSVNTQTAQWENRDNTQTYGYTLNNTYPTSLNQVLTVNYYDDYNIPNLPSTYDKHTSFPASTQSLPTATLTNVLGTSDMLWTVTYYDDRGRAVEVYKQHYLGGMANTGNYDVITSGYDFTNAVTGTQRKHYTTASTSTPALTVENTYVYDHMGRKLQTKERINGGISTIISQEDYNEIGQLKAKHLHSADDGTTFLQKIDYSYNERGWLSTSSAPLFSMQLKYNDGTFAQYNGNIANQLWGTGSLTNTYTYTYDALNRLRKGDGTGNDEKSITYDVMGNIQGMERYLGNTKVDGLKYNYTGNQLQSVTDSTSSDAGYKHGSHNYSYDVNGNMTADDSKGVTNITYNLLNLPKTYTLSGGTVTYTYDAAGTKLRKVSTLGTGSTTDYIGGIQYNKGAIDFVQTEEGRALNLTGTINYEYSLSDHLGNTRRTFDSSTGASAPKQADDYLPFGMDIASTVPSSKNDYLYNKKELQVELGLYDYGARLYDPVIGRWTSVDPLAEKMRRYSPYVYGDDNPIIKIDPDGMQTEDPWWKKALDAVVRLATGNSTSSQDDSGNMPSLDSRTSKINKALATARDANTAVRGAMKATRKGIPKALSNTGDLLTKAGKAAEPVAPEVSTVLLPIGSAVSTAGTFGTGLNQLYDGEYSQAFVTFGFQALNAGFDKLFETGVDKKVITEKQKKALEKVTEKAVDKLKDKADEKAKENDEERNKGS